MLAWTWPFLTALSTATPPPLVPPPIVTQPLEQRLVTWLPGEVRCQGAAVDGSGLLRPAPDQRMLAREQSLEATFTFAIDANGRAHTIARPGPMVFGLNADLAPSLAASQFAPEARSDCTVTYQANALPIAEAALPDLVEYAAGLIPNRPPRTVWDRIGAGGDCLASSPFPQPLVQVNPDYRKIAKTPGRTEWSAVAFELGASGQPENVRVAYGTGHEPLDTAAVEAVSQSRFVEGARKGCLVPFRLNAIPLPAPSSPPETPDEPTCDLVRDWAVKPRLMYPEPYRRRGIEGWARITYDVAPWGEIGNVTVVESQPTEDFGRQAQVMLRGARTKPNQQGASGCNDLVRFVMADGSAPPPEEPQPPPPAF